MDFGTVQSPSKQTSNYKTLSTRKHTLVAVKKSSPININTETNRKQDVETSSSRNPGVKVDDMNPTKRILGCWSA